MVAGGEDVGDRDALEGLRPGVLGVFEKSIGKALGQGRTVVTHDAGDEPDGWLRGDSVLLCEANVPPSEIGTFVGSRPDGPSDRAQMMFDFLLNPRRLAGPGSLATRSRSSKP